MEPTTRDWFIVFDVFLWSVGKEQNDLDEILRELLGDSHSGATTSSTTSKTTSRQLDGNADGGYTRERQEYMNPDGSTTTIERRKYKTPNVTENITYNKVQNPQRHRKDHVGLSQSTKPPKSQETSRITENVTRGKVQKPQRHRKRHV